MSMNEDYQILQKKLQRLEAREAFYRQTLADILAFSSRLTRNTDLKTLYRESNALAQRILKLDFSTLMILNDDGKALIIRDALGFPSSMINTFALLEGQGLSTHVVTGKKAAIVEDFQTENRFEVPPVVFKHGIVSAVAVPMLLGEVVFGVMIGHTRTKHIFSPEEIDLYQSIANQTAVAIKNIMHFQSLQDSEKRIRALIDGGGDAIFLADMSGRLVDVNAMSCQILGYTREELLTLTVFDVDPLAAAIRPHETLWPKLSPEQHVTVTSRHRRKDGSLFPVEIRIGLLPLHDTNYVLGFARDITERQQAELERQKLQEQLIQAQKMESIGTLAGGIAHDFNNILTPIFGYLELAMLNLEADSPLMGNLNAVLEAAGRAHEMVKQILTFGRGDSEKISPIKVDAIIKEALKLLRASIPTTIEIRQDLAANCGYVLANSTHIHQVLMNICTNAYHAMKETGGILGVSLIPVSMPADDHLNQVEVKPGPYLLLEISDTGDGMDQATRKRIFDPYFTTKANGEGTGMGLAVVHEIIKKINGRITVHSEPGKGATFRIYLPVIEKFDSADEISPGDSVLPTGTERIMLVDDEECVRDIVEKMLSRLGYEVTTFANPTEALNFFSAQPDCFDLVITDMTMPKLTGDNLAQNIMQIRPDMPIILCSGFSDLINEESARKKGIREFVAKPVSLQPFSRIVRRVLDGR